MNRDGIGRWQYRNSPRMLFAPISQSWYSKSKYLCLGISWGQKQLEATSFCTMQNSYDFLAPKKAQKSMTKTPDTARLCLDTLFTIHQILGYPWTLCLLCAFLFSWFISVVCVFTFYNHKELRNDDQFCFFMKCNIMKCWELITSGFV